MTSQALWYLTRATGIVALVLLTGTIVLGVLGTARVATERWPRIVTAGLHRNLALTAISLVGVHVLTTLLDPFAPIGLADVFIPFGGSYRPFWLGLGSLAFDMLAAAIVTSLIRDRLSHRLWQGVHLMVYACWPVALWHGLGTGTDTRLTLVLGIDAICAVAVLGAVAWRLSLTGNARLRTAGLLAMTALILATLIFVLVGPLRPGWALRSGTPPSLVSFIARRMSR
jgi:sulfoxide reductase heme-binding subunit YedZ